MNNTHTLSLKQKQTLGLSLKLWLPILQSPISELDKIFKAHSYDNPFLKSTNKSKNRQPSSPKASFYSSDNEYLQETSAYKPSLYDKLLGQIEPPLFPTPRSQRVAKEIINNINEDGYFDGDITQIAIECQVTNEFVESIRKRFAYIEPVGIGSKDIEESFLFQMQELEIDNELMLFLQKIIKNITKIDKYHTHHRFDEALAQIKKFRSPPAIEYKEESPAVIPDFFVEVDDDIKIKINNDYYPDIVVQDPFGSKSDELRQKLKEARNLVNLLELRKSTLYKLVLVIVEKQIGFFIGSELKPLTMAEVASELGFEESSISRAVSNKYIQCSLGIFPLKHFFTNAVANNLSSSEIKSFLLQLIDHESHESPLTDDDIVQTIQKRYGLSLVRRTITKYRKLLDIPSSKERKKLYKLSH
jgi:RNA polymerase sigma-54 factor